tara:strand:- start:1295 stop:2257 length:963 start_codon:yes stop_codon:yes gene_type:complete
MMKVTNSKNQLKLYGYENYFNIFLDLFNKNKLPNVMLFSGPKGTGKATFAYHLINYIFTHKTSEKNKYKISDFEISEHNSSYKLLSDKIHPNLFVLENHFDDLNIKVSEVRNLIKFIGKSTYLNDLKIILIDNAEYLNNNSSNALLKVLEEANYKTFFFIIHNSSSKILDTIKSRSVKFRFNFNIEQKSKILANLFNQYELNLNMGDFLENLQYQTPGNLLRFMYLFSKTDIDINKDVKESILYLIDKYKSKKDNEFLYTGSFLIEKYFNFLIKRGNTSLNELSFAKENILNKLNNIKIFNLDKKSLYFSLEGLFHNEGQ